MILGLGIVAAAVTYVSQPVQVASALPTVRKSGSVPEPGSRASAGSPAWSTANGTGSSRVSLGQKFELASGLMEITYDTGAKVILQGPVTYEVEANGGYLAVGKLTGKLEKKVASGQSPVASEINKSQIPNPKSLTTDHRPLTTDSNPQSLIPNPFVIRTPTATVTDLGTEFGVEVAKDGASVVHVLKGLVEARFRDPEGRDLPAVRLKEGEGRCYDRRLGRVAAIPIDWAKFETMHIVTASQRWLTYSRQLRQRPGLLAYYTFEKNSGPVTVLPNLSAAGSALDGEIQNAEWISGRLPGKLSLYFHGAGSGDKVVLPDQERFNFTGPFSVAVWFKAERSSGMWQALVSKGDDSWRLQQNVDAHRIALGTNAARVSRSDAHVPAAGIQNHLADNPSAGETAEPYRVAIGESEVDDGRWHLAIAVFEPVDKCAKKYLYLDGRLDGQGESPRLLHRNRDPVCLGANSAIAGREFQGEIDEVAIFQRALSAQEVANMYEAGKPADLHWKWYKEK